MPILYEGGREFLAGRWPYFSVHSGAPGLESNEIQTVPRVAKVMQVSGRSWQPDSNLEFTLTPDVDDIVSIGAWDASVNGNLLGYIVLAEPVRYSDLNAATLEIPAELLQLVVGDDPDITDAGVATLYGLTESSTPLYASLHAAALVNGELALGAELTTSDSPGYTREALAFQLSGNLTRAVNEAQIQWGASGRWTIEPGYIGIYDAVTGGNLLYSFRQDFPTLLISGGTWTIARGNLDLDMQRGLSMPGAMSTGDASNIPTNDDIEDYALISEPFVTIPGNRLDSEVLARLIESLTGNDRLSYEALKETPDVSEFFDGARVSGTNLIFTREDGSEEQVPLPNSGGLADGVVTAAEVDVNTKRVTLTTSLGALIIFDLSPFLTTNDGGVIISLINNTLGDSTWQTGGTGGGTGGSGNYTYLVGSGNFDVTSPRHFATEANSNDITLDDSDWFLVNVLESGLGVGPYYRIRGDDWRGLTPGEYGGDSTEASTRIAILGSDSRSGSHLILLGRTADNKVLFGSGSAADDPLPLTVLGEMEGLAPVDVASPNVMSDNTLTGIGTSDDPLSVAIPFTQTEKTKLAGIESAATADQDLTGFFNGARVSGNNLIFDREGRPDLLITLPSTGGGTGVSDGVVNSASLNGTTKIVTLRTSTGGTVGLDLSDLAALTDIESFARDGNNTQVPANKLGNQRFTAADETKLDGIDGGAEVNVQADWNETQTSNDAYIRNKPDIPEDPASWAEDGNTSQIPANKLGNQRFTAADETKLDNIQAGAEVNVGVEFTQAEKTKLGGVETGAEVNVGVEYTQAEKTKLGGVETGAQANVGVEFAQTDKTKLDGIDPGAQVNPPSGQLVPSGGTSGQVLGKTSATDYATGWVDAATGGGGGGGGGGVISTSLLGSGVVDFITNSRWASEVNTPDITLDDSPWFLVALQPRGAQLQYSWINGDAWRGLTAGVYGGSVLSGTYTITPSFDFSGNSRRARWGRTADNKVLVELNDFDEDPQTLRIYSVGSASSGGGGGDGLASVASDETITGNGTTGSPLAVANPFTDADETKLDGIAAGAEVNVGVEFTQAEKTKLGTVADSAEVNVQADWNQTQTNNDAYIRNKPDIPEDPASWAEDGNTSQIPANKLGNQRFTAADETKLDGIQAGAEANVGVEFTQAEKTKLGGVETGAEVNVGVEFTQAEKTKLDGITPGAGSGLATVATENYVLGDGSDADKVRLDDTTLLRDWIGDYDTPIGGSSSGSGTAAAAPGNYAWRNVGNAHTVITSTQHEDNRRLQGDAALSVTRIVGAGAVGYRVVFDDNAGTTLGTVKFADTGEDTQRFDIPTGTGTFVRGQLQVQGAGEYSANVTYRNRRLHSGDGVLKDEIQAEIHAGTQHLTDSLVSDVTFTPQTRNLTVTTEGGDQRVVNIPEADISDLFKDAEINGGILRLTREDDTVVNLTLPTGTAVADGVVVSATLNQTTKRVTITTSTGDTINLDLANMAALREVETYARVGNSARVPDARIDTAIARTSALPRTGQLVPAGGTGGQVLSKRSATDYATEWVDAASGGGGGAGGNTSHLVGSGDFNVLEGTNFATEANSADITLDDSDWFLVNVGGHTAFSFPDASWEWVRGDAWRGLTAGRYGGARNTTNTLDISVVIGSSIEPLYIGRTADNKVLVATLSGSSDARPFSVRGVNEAALPTFVSLPDTPNTPGSPGQTLIWNPAGDALINTDVGEGGVVTLESEVSTLPIGPVRQVTRGTVPDDTATLPNTTTFTLPIAAAGRDLEDGVTVASNNNSIRLANAGSYFLHLDLEASASVLTNTHQALSGGAVVRAEGTIQVLQNGRVVARGVMSYARYGGWQVDGIGGAPIVAEAGDTITLATHVRRIDSGVGSLNWDGSMRLVHQYVTGQALPGAGIESATVNNIVTLSQSAYDAISSPDGATVYIVTG